MKIPRLCTLFDLSFHYSLPWILKSRINKKKRERKRKKGKGEKKESKKRKRKTKTSLPFDKDWLVVDMGWNTYEKKKLRKKKKKKKKKKKEENLLHTTQRSDINRIRDFNNIILHGPPPFFTLLFKTLLSQTTKPKKKKKTKRLRVPILIMGVIFNKKKLPESTHPKFSIFGRKHSWLG